MGDFDRNATAAKPNEAKKLVVVLALGVVLIGLVAVQFMKRGTPQSAVGAPVGNGVALPPPVLREEISPQALAAMLGDLQNDPTRPLLKGGPAGNTLPNTPRNPFRMSSAWLQSLFAPPPVTPTIVPVVPVATAPYVPPVIPVATAPYIPPVIPVALQAADYKLSGILNGSMAVLNGKVVKAGDVLGKARVLDISDTAVRLQHADFPNGPTLVLSMGSILGD